MGTNIEGITLQQKERIEKTLFRAEEQGKIASKEDAIIKVNAYGDVWLSWRNPRRSFRFTIFHDGTIHSGLFGTEQINE